MARTAPAPNIPPIPGMCPSIAVLAGGGDMGNGSGDSAGDGSGDDHAGAGKGGENAEADGRGAPDYEKYPECGYASHPVDVVTGRAFTHPITDLALPGPLPFAFDRMYSSKAAHLDMGLGHGWAHTFGWRVEVRRRSIVVWNEQGIAVDFPMIRPGDEVVGPWGWVLRRETWGFAVDADDDVWHLFSEVDPRRPGFYLLTAIDDRNRNRIALTYDDGRLVEVVDSAKRVIAFEPTREGRIAAIRVKLGEGRGVFTAATYLYDDRGDLVAATDANGATARYAYDDDHRLVSDADRTGLTFHFRYDAEGRCVESWGDYPGKADPSLDPGVPALLADGVTRAKGVHHCRFDYSAGGYSEVADSRQVRRFFGNRFGTLDKSVDGGRVMTCTYDADGHLLSRADGAGAVWSFVRDRRGRPVQVTDPLGRSTVVERDAAGLPVRVVDANGGELTFERDRFGNVVLFTDATGAATSYAYDARGLCTLVVSPNGARTTFAYDAEGLCTAVVEPDGGAWAYRYDALGRLIAATDPLGAVTRREYSATGDPIAVHRPDGGTIRFEYDGEGNLVRFTDANGATRRYTWGGYRRVVTGEDPAGHVVRCTYSREGEMLAFVNELGQRCSLAYDTTGNLVSVETFDGRRIAYAYDPGQRTKAIKDARGRTELAYDLVGKLVKVTWPDGAADTFDHDAMGRMIAARTDDVEVIFERDARGDVVREVQTVRGDAHHVESVFDALRDRIGRQTSLGHVEGITRDAFGDRRETTLGGSHIVRHAFDGRGREVLRELPRGGRIESAYDVMGRVARRRGHSPTIHRPGRAGEPDWLGRDDAGATAETRYTYDAADEIAEAWDDRRGGRRYTYDPIGQLLGALPEEARPELFRYDAAGNVHEDGAGAEPREYGPGNLLLRKGAATYRWNDDRTLAEKTVTDPATGAASTWRYAWDGRGRLAAVTLPDGGVVELEYDALARRVGKRVYTAVPGRKPRLVSATRFVWDRDALVHEITGRGPETRERTYWFDDGSLEPVAHGDTARDGAGEPITTWYFYLNDPVGTPERLLTETGEVACAFERTAFGALRAAPGARTSTPLRLEGQYHDEETGLSYNRYRYYDPDAGRFISADPLGLAAGPNFFAFGVNPIGWTDPFGLDWNYRLRDSSGNVYYHGKAGDNLSENDVMRRHSNTVGSDGPRFREGIGGNGDTLERVTDKVTGDEARGIEHVGITNGKTNTCPRRAKGAAMTSGPVRGNKDEGIGKEKLKTTKGQKRKNDGLAKLGGQDPHTMTPVSKWQRDPTTGSAVKVP